MVSAVTILLVVVVIGALYVVLARADGPGPSRTPGSVAYSVTIGVIGILAGGGMILSGLWLLLVAVAGPGVLFNAASPAQIFVGVLGLVVIVSGVLIFRLARRRLLRT